MIYEPKISIEQLFKSELDSKMKYWREIWMMQPFRSLLSYHGNMKSFLFRF